MSKDLKIQVLLSAMDKLSAPFKNAQKATQQLSSVLNENKTKLRTLSKEYNKNESQIKKYRDTLNPLKSKLTENTQALKNSYAEIRRMKSALKKMSSPTAEFTKKLDEAKKSKEKLKKEQTETIAKLKEARNQFQRNGVSASQLGQRQRELQAKMKGANKEIDQQRAKLDKLNEKARRQNTYRQRVDSLRTKAEQYANIGGRAMATHTMMKDKIAQPVSAFAQAEVAATNLKVAMMDKDGKVPETFEKVNKLAMQLGDKLPGTTADFQDLMTMLVRQGMSVETILGGTGEAAAYLSVQLEMPPKQAAEFAAKMQDATRTTEKDMMDLMDVIQKGFYAGVDPTNMLGAFKNLGSAMDLIKVKGLEGAKAFAPFVAMFDQAGMDGSSQGNAMRKVLKKGMDTAKIQKALKDLKGDKLLPKNFNLDFTNGKGEFGGFDNLFKQLDKLKTLTTEAREAVIKEIFGNDAEVNMVLSTLIEKGKAGYEEFAEKMEKQAALRKRVDEQLKTLTNIWEATTGTFTNLLAEIGATIAPQLKQLSEELGEIAEKIKSWVKANPELTGTLMKIAAVLTAVIGITGALASAFSFLLFPIGRSALFIGSLAKTMITAIPSILAFSTALLTNPLTWIVVGIVAVIAAIVLLMKNFDTVVKYLKISWDWVCDMFNTGWENIKVFFNSGIGNITATILNWSPLGLFYKAFAAVLSWFGVDLPKDFSGFGKLVMDKLGEGFMKAFETVRNTISKTVDWIKEKLGFGEDTEKKLAETKQNVANATANAMNGAGNYYMQGLGYDVVNNNKWSGGYAGNGGKYEPKGIFHGGEYIMTKEATSRLGIHTLNALNYGKQALIAGGLGVSVATAAPVQVDHRPPISARPIATQVTQPMNVQITINAAPGMNEKDIGRIVEQKFRQIQNQQQARSRSILRDRV
ncbi:phage tail tape measure protein [Rodentibacter trehalosifermentans]|uniref:Phage tail tape measure protein n=1 Tax=Rodentibacter trehalosifermentans TaxID=1908263 RepID=A0A1V3ISJ9_9PAST|nr:phage tail tape measure protein [Rodentibacter trehalosifermentans]OOF45258.1 phage tail tape measure protein [Rodentibacter trehalosifermentans]